MYLAYSGGKDSSVILDLALKVNPKILIIHNPKYSTHPDTVVHIYKVSMEHNILLVPFYLMLFFVKNNGLECQIDGTTIEEHNRTGKSSDLIVNGLNVSRKYMKQTNPKGIWDITSIYPIFDWTEQMVFEYLKRNNVKISEEYKL